MGTVVHAVSVVRLNFTTLPSCSWLPGFPPPWNWLPLKMVTLGTGSVGKTGSRMPALPNGSGLLGRCHALPRFTMWNPPCSVPDVRWSVLDDRRPPGMGEVDLDETRRRVVAPAGNSRSWCSLLGQDHVVAPDRARLVAQNAQRDRAGRRGDGDRSRRGRALTLQAGAVERAEPGGAGWIGLAQPAAVHGADLGVVNVVSVAEGAHVAAQHGDDGALAYEQGELRLVGVGPRDELAARMRGVGPEVQPGPGGEVKLALRRVRGQHRGDQELVAEAVDVLDRIRVGVGLVEQDERADDRQPGRARLLRVGVDVREQADVQPGEELVVGQGLVAEPPGELQLAGDLAVHLHDR